MAQLGNSKIFGDLEVTGNIKLGGSNVITTNATQILVNKTLTSPVLNGTPTAPTAAVSANSTQVATTAFVLAKINDEATNANTVNKIVKRDASGNFSAGTITAALTGNASTATKLAAARTISLTGGVTGSVSFDGSGNVSIAATVTPDSHNHTTLTGVTSIAFNTDSSDKASIGRTIDGTTTYFDFNLSDDLGSDQWRWRFTNAGTAYNVMTLKSPTAGKASLEVTGMVQGETLTSTVATGTAPLKVTSTTAVANLNADLLDGRQGSAYMYTHAITTSGTDMDTIIDSGAYRLGNSIVNAPSGLEYGQMLVLHGGGDTVTQLITDYRSNLIYWRSGNPTSAGGTGTYGAWSKIWHQNNDGSGSGLDADLLDGKEASAFALVSHTHTKSNITDFPTKLSQFTNDLNLGSSETFNYVAREEEFTTASGVRTFTLTKGAYVAGSGTLEIYIEGQKIASKSITENSNTSFTLPEGIANGSLVLARYVSQVNAIPPGENHGSSHLTGGLDPIPLVTTTTNGLMSSADKVKLNGINTSLYETKTNAASVYLTKESAAGTYVYASQFLELSVAVTGLTAKVTKIHKSTAAPVASDGANGDLWIVY